MTRLSVNLNKIALVRNSRQSGVPSVTHAADVAVANGAAGITVHPRPDQRHIRPADVRELKARLSVELNIEGNPFEPTWMSLVLETRPAQATLVPDASDQLTSDHGWQLQPPPERLRPLIVDLKAAGIRVSLFVDADVTQMALARDLGADRVELYTGPYAEADHLGGASAKRSLEQYRAAAIAAQQCGLGVNAGHDLSLQNLAAFLQHVPGVAEVSIGHALVVDALELGLAEAVRRYVALCEAATGR
jgi:pyridoxine 5-phosphate synthase